MNQKKAGPVQKMKVVMAFLLCAMLTPFTKDVNKLEGKRDQAALFIENERAMGVIDAVLTVVIGAVTMGIGAMILAKIQPNVVGTTNESNASIAGIFTTAWDAMGMLPIVLIVIVAVVILGAVMMLAQGQRNK